MTVRVSRSKVRLHRINRKAGRTHTADSAKRMRQGSKRTLRSKSKGKHSAKNLKMFYRKTKTGTHSYGRDRSAGKTGRVAYNIRQSKTGIDEQEREDSAMRDDGTWPELPSPPESEAAEMDRLTAYAEGYREGCFEGGEAKLGKLIPQYRILPELAVDDVIAAGFRSIANLLLPLMTPADVYGQMSAALQNGKPLSVVRLGDGELLTLAHDAVLPAEEAKRWGRFLPYAGVTLPDPKAREALAWAVRAADIVGIPESRHPSYQGLLFPVLRHYGIDYRTLIMTSSTINYSLNGEGYLGKLLTGRKILIIGNEASRLSAYLNQHGYEVSGVIAPVHGVADVSRVMELTRGIPFDIALVAAGIAAVILCPRIAREHGKVALDLGHVANKLAKGEVRLSDGIAVSSE